MVESNINDSEKELQTLVVCTSSRQFELIDTSKTNCRALIYKDFVLKNFKNVIHDKNLVIETCIFRSLGLDLINMQLEAYLDKRLIIMKNFINTYFNKNSQYQPKT